MSRSYRQVLGGISLAILALACKPGLASPLGFEEGLRLAQQRSLRLPAQDAAATTAREMAAAAGQRPDPTLKAGISNLPVSGDDRFSLTRDFMTMRSIGVMQEFTRESKLKARSARYERELDAAIATRQLLLANLQRDTATAWLERYFQERMRELLVRQRDEATLQVAAAEAAYRGGKGSQADVFTARSAAAQLSDRVAQAQRDVAIASTQLERWVGTPDPEPSGAPPALDRIALDDSDLAQRMAHHPQIAVLAQQEAIAQADVDLARSNKQADASVELMVSQRGPAYSKMISVAVSVPLQWDQRNRQDRELAAKLAAVDQWRAEREEATRAHVAEARAMLQQWRNARERLQRYDAVLQPLAQERTQAALAAYRGNAGSLAAVLDARRAEIDTRMDRLRLDMEAARLWTQLTYLVPVEHGQPEDQR